MENTDAFVEGKLKPVIAFNEVYIEAPRLIGYSFRPNLKIESNRSVLVRAFIKLSTPLVESQPYIIVITNYKSFNMVDLVSYRADPVDIADAHRSRLMKEKFNYSVGILSFINKKLFFYSNDRLANYIGQICGFPMAVEESDDELSLEKILAQFAPK